MDIVDPRLRTSFFIKLINGLNGYIFEDVSDAYVFHPKPDKIEDEEDDVEIGIHITRASLKGEGVLKSEELLSLYDRGFYIWKIRWTAKENLPDPDVYEFEAQFSNQLDFNGFSYSIKGVKKYKGHGEYNKTFASLTRTEESKFHRLIEEAAYKIISDIESESRG